MTSNAKYPDPTSGWQPHQKLITQLYRDEGLPLPEVMKIMETQHGFKATKKMYMSRIHKWGLDKKNKSHEVEEILRLQATRKSQGKKTSFLLRGRAIDMADIERYARRKGLIIPSNKPSSTRAGTIPDLVCFTPSPSPRPLDDPTSSRDVERFLHSFHAFVTDSLQSGAWTLDGNVCGFETVRGPEYPKSARNGFFLAIERGVQKYRWREITQAFRQWRQAFHELISIIRSRKPSQLICLVELVARLAECEAEVTALLLRHLGQLVGNNGGESDTRLAMLQNLSRLEVKQLNELARLSHDCSWNVFHNHFSAKSFYLLDSESVLTRPTVGREPSALPTSLSPNDFLSPWHTYDPHKIRATRTTMELLMMLERHAEAEKAALDHIRRLEHMPYNGVTGGAISHAYGYVVHLYLSTEDYQKAYRFMLKKAENFVELLSSRPDLSEDSAVVMYSQLASVARKLGKDDEAGKWDEEYKMLKKRTDMLAETEASSLPVTNQEHIGWTNGKLEQTGKSVDLGQSLSVSLPESPPEANIEASFSAPPCSGHNFGPKETKSELGSTQLPLRPSSGRQVGGGGGGRSRKGPWAAQMLPCISPWQ